MSFGQRVAQGTDFARQRADAAEDRQIRKMMTAAQIAKMQRDAAFDQQFLGGGLLGAAPAAAGGTATTAAPGGGGGSVPGAPASGATAGGPAAGGGMSAVQISQRYGIPLDQVLADFRFNGGKKLAEFIADRSKPNWVNVNGNLVNTNAQGFAGGVQPGLSVSNNGQATAWEVGPDGQIVVGAPRGALDTYKAYQGISDRSRAANTPGRPTILPGGRMGGQSQLDEISGGPASSPAPVLPGAPLGAGGPVNGVRIPNPMAPRPGDNDRVQIYTQELREAQQRLASATTPDDQRRAQSDIDGLLQEMRSNRIPMPAGAAPSALPGRPLGAPAAPPAAVVPAQPEVQGGGLEFSPEEKAAQEGARTAAVERSKATVARETEQAAASKRAGQFEAAGELASQLLDQGPTGSGVGSLADRVGNFVGQPLKGASQAQQLKALGGWLTANVPRMEGPQSNTDVLNYQTMAGQVGDDTLPVSTRKAALSTVLQLQRKYAALNGGAAPGPSAPAAVTLPPGWTVKVK
ncbi:hypothetical protein [Variovorax sp. JS1663]|uniref:hypothetical protein n=1 Tax=Variovorax sp. JS1663 TaxID=1851577 RepID=UPI000B348F5D|nr:hypothetical protein [Variovorax sp. JS1663]OUM01745.1 hypothetical protein A8M77_14380 [Variovorax sp. JS1663]